MSEVPIEIDRPVALTMNFPQIPSNSVEFDFDYQCSDCLAELFGPIVAPYALLREQSEDYRNHLKIITEKRFQILKNNLLNKRQRIATVFRSICFD